MVSMTDLYPPYSTSQGPGCTHSQCCKHRREPNRRHSSHVIQTNQLIYSGDCYRNSALCRPNHCFPIRAILASLSSRSPCSAQDPMPTSGQKCIASVARGQRRRYEVLRSLGALPPMLHRLSNRWAFYSEYVLVFRPLVFATSAHAMRSPC